MYHKDLAKIDTSCAICHQSLLLTHFTCSYTEASRFDKDNRGLYLKSSFVGEGKTQLVPSELLLKNPFLEAWLTCTDCWRQYKITLTNDGFEDWFTFSYCGVAGVDLVKEIKEKYFDDDGGIKKALSRRETSKQEDHVKREGNTND